MSKALFKVNVSGVVRRGNMFFVIKRADDEDVFPGHWGIPGGTVEPTDASLAEALQREFIEEVGVSVDCGELLSTNTVQREGKPTMLFLVFKASLHEGVPEPKEDTAEVAWKTLDELRELRLTPKTLEILEAC